MKHKDILDDPKPPRRRETFSQSYSHDYGDPNDFMDKSGLYSHKDVIDDRAIYNSRNNEVKQKPRRRNIEMPPATIERQTVGMMMRANQIHKRLSDKRAEELKIHVAQHKLLMEIAASDCRISQRQISEIHNVTPAAIAMTMRRLEDNGYVVRENFVYDDGRYKQVTITERGKEEIKTATAYFDMIDEAMFKGFSEEDKKELLRLLSLAKDNLQDFEVRFNKENKK